MAYIYNEKGERVRVPDAPVASSTNTMTGWESMTGKQRCSTVGGTLVAIGIVLCGISMFMNSHNEGLRADVESADIAVRDANRNLTARHVITTEQMQRQARIAYEAASEASRAELRRRASSHSEGLITLLFVLGSLAFLSGFVLVIVGLVIPEQKNP